MNAPVVKLIDFFENLTPAAVARLHEFYTPDVYFKDPFNEVWGLAEVQRIFSHMFVALAEPRFVITGQLVDGHQCFLSWNFEFRFRRFSPAALQTVRGGSHLKFTAEGLIDYHRDYWDAAEELYEKLPGLGGLMRWLKKRAQA